MALGFKIGVDNDLAYSDGALELVSEADEIARNVKTRLKLLKGEFTLDTRYGLPYNILIGSHVFDLAELETIIKQFILETKGIVSLSRFNLAFKKENERLLEVDFTATTIYGRIVVTDALSRSVDDDISVSGSIAWLE